MKIEDIGIKNIYNMNIKVTYYARVSTDNDSQNTSIINQIEFFDKYIENNKNWTKVKGYIDEGISAKNTKKRTNFLKMIEDAKNQKFDLILTKNVSRFARNTIDSIKYTDILKEVGVAIIFINDNINTFSRDSEFRLTLMASIAQDEIRKLSDSVKFGLKQSINRGIVLGNNNILGYKKKKGKLIIINKESQIVKDIFQLFSQDKYSYSKVAQIINNKYNRTFDSTSIKRILTNHKYKGYYCGHKSIIIDYKTNKRININQKDWIIYKDNKKVPPIVEEELWNKCNNIINKRTSIRRKNTNKLKIKCLNCNKYYKYIFKKYKNKGYGYYICNNCGIISENIIIRINNIIKIKNIKQTKHNKGIIIQVER